MTAALLALLLLSYASIQSTVMQVAMARPGATAPERNAGLRLGAITGMAQMSMAAPSGRSSRHAPAHSNACPYCAAAAHLATLGGSTPFQPYTAFTFTAFRVVATHGPRGPPSSQPRARGPPLSPLTL